MTDFALHPVLEADSHFLRDLALCQVRLHGMKAVPWLLLIPRRASVKELFQLTQADRAQLMEEVVLASRVLEQAFSVDKINVGALGNIVPQLHVHVIARTVTDPAWPNPVWGNVPSTPYEPEDLARIQKKIKESSVWS